MTFTIQSETLGEVKIEIQNIELMRRISEEEWKNLVEKAGVELHLKISNWLLWGDREE